jgi:hypothetical protein
LTPSPLRAIIALDSADRKRARRKSEMAAQGLDTLQALESHHPQRMDMPLKRALLLRADGESDREAADGEGVSESTMRTRIAVASAEIALCLNAPRRLPGELRGFWIRCHLQCCLAEAYAALRGGRP